MELFDETERPDAAAFYRRGDPNDKRLGDLVGSEPFLYAEADVVLLGSPQDEGVRRNKGRPGAAEGPAAIRRAFYRLAPTGPMAGLHVFDLGDVPHEGELEETHARQKAVVRRLLDDRKAVIVLGGGNDVSYPDCAALAESADGCAAFNIDSHYDVRSADRRNSGTPYRQLLEEGHLRPDRFFELGIQPFANAAGYGRYLEEKGVRVETLESLRDRGVEPLLRELLGRAASNALFFGFDMDAVRSSDAPGVSASYPTGLSAEEVLLIASLAGGDPRTRVVEISETNPRFDVDGRTAKLAALIAWTYLRSLAERGPSGKG